MGVLSFVSLLFLAAQPAPTWRAEVDALKAKGDAAGALARLAHAPVSAAMEDETGFLLAVLGRRSEALDHFRKAVAIDPKFAAGHYHLGVALWLQGDQTPALESLAKASALGTK